MQVAEGALQVVPWLHQERPARLVVGEIVLDGVQVDGWLPIEHQGLEGVLAVSYGRCNHRPEANHAEGPYVSQLQDLIPMRPFHVRARPLSLGNRSASTEKVQQAGHGMRAALAHVPPSNEL